MTHEQLLLISRKSLFAGIMIGIAATCYTRCPNTYVGAFLFSFGLLMILNFDGYLFTGRVGYFDWSKQTLHSLLIILLMNIIGVIAIALITQNPESLIFTNKVNRSILTTTVLSFLCGVMMYLAVESWKKKSELIYVILAIMIFIISGFDHCIANFYYFAINPIPNMNANTFWFFIVNILGNSIGSLGIRYLINGR